MASRATEGSLFTGDERARIKRIGEPIALALGRLGFTPDALTVAGFGIVLVAASAAVAGQWILTALILIFGTLFDGLDGTLARATGKTSSFGAFLDSTMDRAGEVVIYAGIAAGAAVNGRTEVIGLATLALGTGTLVSYVRARGEGLGVCANIGIAQRAERAAVLIVGLLLGGLASATWLTVALLIISVASAITVVQRIRFIRAGLADERRRVERAPARILDQSVLQRVARIACRDGGLGDQGQLGGGEDRRPIRVVRGGPRPHEAKGLPDAVVGRGARNDAVVVVGETLRFRQGLVPASGAAHEIRLVGKLALRVADHKLRRVRHDMDRAPPIVNDLLRMALSEDHVVSGVPGVSAGRGVAAPEGARPSAETGDRWTCPLFTA